MDINGDLSSSRLSRSQRSKAPTKSEQRTSASNKPKSNRSSSTHDSSTAHSLTLPSSSCPQPNQILASSGSPDQLGSRRAQAFSESLVDSSTSNDHHHQETLSESSSSISSQRNLSPFSAPATPATAISTSTTVSSSTRNAGKRAREALEGQRQPLTSELESSVLSTPSRTSTGASSNKNGKGKAKEPSNTWSPASSSSSSVPSSRKTRSVSSATKKGSTSKHHPNQQQQQQHNQPQSSSKKRSSDAALDLQASNQTTSKKPRTGSGTYNFRPRKSESESTPQAKDTKMAARKNSEEFTATRSTSGSQHHLASGSKSKGKNAVKSKTSKVSRSTKASLRDNNPNGHDFLDYNEEASDQEYGCQDEEKPRNQLFNLDVEMTSGEKTSENAEGESKGSKSRSTDQNELEAQAGDLDPSLDENDHDETHLDQDEEMLGIIDDQHDEDEEARNQDDVDEEDDEDDDEDDEDPYDEAKEDDGAGVFGLNLRAMAGYMSGLSSRFRSLLASLRDRSDPSVQLVALQELSELLSVSTEDTIAGYFPTNSYVEELLYIMGGPKPDRSDESNGSKSRRNKSNDDKGDDEMAAVLAAAAAADMEDSGEEKMLLACRCLANLIEAMPYAAHNVVSHGAIPILNSKLMEITFIDLAEQVLQTLEKISHDYPGSIVKEGGLSAILQYLDFFNIHVQRTAMTAAANCCRKLSADSFHMVRDVLPTIQNVLTYSDQRLVESACKCVVRVIESYRSQPDLLEQLLSKELLSAVNNLLLPASSNGGGGSNTSVSTNTYTDMLKALGTACRASPKVAVTLLENNIVETLYHLLTGSPAPSDDKSAAQAIQANAFELESPSTQSKGSEAAAVAVVSDAGGSVAVADMAVLQNLARRPKEQVQEALSLVGELLPPLPRDGVFDSRAYTERAYIKRKSREGRQTRRSNSSRSELQATATSIKVEPDADEALDDDTNTNVTSKKEADNLRASADDVAASPSTFVSHAKATSSKTSRPKSEREVAKETRIEMLKNRTQPVKRFTQLVFPTLVEVYAASVTLHVRTKAINGILKILSFVESEPLYEVLNNVPLASFVAAVLSSRDHPSLVNGALQIVELLTIKLPKVYTGLLRREGVMWEIEDIAAQEPSSGKSEKGPDDSAKAKTEPQRSPLSLPGAGSFSSTSNVLPASGSKNTLESSLAASASAGLGRLLASTAEGYSLNGFNLDASSLRTSLPSSSQSVAETTDTNIWRARVLRDKYTSEAINSEGAQRATQALDDIKDIVHKLNTQAEADEGVAKQTIQQLTWLFSRREETISSFELLRSGLVEALYAFATKSSDGVPLYKRRSILIEALMTVDKSGNTAASVLAHKLQDSLSRLENLEITTALSGGSEDLRRSPTAILGRQIRLRLQADDATDIPRSCNNIVVTIHAIATFQSLSDYLRPKIAASASLSSLGSGSSSDVSSRLSGVLAAFAAAASGGLGDFGSSSSSSRLKSFSNVEKKMDSTTTNAGETSSSLTHERGKDEPTKTVQRRRSSRLSGKGLDPEGSTDQPKSKDADLAEPSSSSKGKSSSTSAPTQDATHHDDSKEGSGATNASEDEARAIAERLFGRSVDETDEALAQRLMEGLLHGGELDEDGFSEEEFDEEILQSEIPLDPSATDNHLDAEADAANKTINLDVDKEAGKVVAKTPEGTRIATPSHGAGTPKGQESSTLTGSPSKGSYASALQKTPADWHLEFLIGEDQLSLDTTIYGAVHRFETNPKRGNAANPQNRNIWGNVYTVKYKKVAGPVPQSAPTATPEPPDVSSAAIELPPSIKEDAPYAKLLQLLAVLHDLNAEWREIWQPGIGTSVDLGNKAPALSESVFINNKLTAKLNRQLEEPMIVASSCLPEWSMDLPKKFPFLFPFEARFAFLQSTSFGYARLITRWQNLHSRNQDNSSSSSRLDDSFGFLGRLQRQKVRISRANLLASAFKVFELYGSNSSVLEVEYFDEAGTGLGPTLEFYSLVSKDFARKDLKLWRDDDSGGSGTDYVYSPLGLFPVPIDESQLETGETDKRLHSFKILGQFVAKALLDSRIIDCHFSPVFLRAVLNQPLLPNLATLSSVDPTLARSLSSMQRMSADEVESLSLDFTVPGYPNLELHPGGRDETVSASNLDQYISEVLQMTLETGIKPAVRVFRQGFSLIFSITAMSSFTADELVMLFGNTDEDWSEATLMSSIKPDHGFNLESSTFKDLVAIMACFSLTERREFLQWLTGSPKLPIGGFAGLHPQLTVVKRPHEAPLKPDDYLPSVMTCVNYLKMPQFSNRQKMRAKLETAMKEGTSSFHLS